MHPVPVRAQPHDEVTHGYHFCVDRHVAHVHHIFKFFTLSCNEEKIAHLIQLNVNSTLKMPRGLQSTLEHFGVPEEESTLEHSETL